MKKARGIKLTLSIMLLSGVIIALVWLWRNTGLTRPIEATPVMVTASRRNFTASVLATGAVRPQIGAQVHVGARISGKVTRLTANIGNVVHKGQVIAELEKDDLLAMVAQRQAELDLAQAKLSALHALRPREIPRAQAEVDQWEATAALGRKELEREDGLLKGDFTTRQAHDRAKERLSVAKAQLAAAKKRLEALATRYDQDLIQAQAEIARCKALLEQARVQLSYATLVAPISGVIASVSTQEGETVAAGLNAPTFVTIIDLNRLQVDAYVDEVDIGKVKVGQKAVFTVDAFPGQEFFGKGTAIYPNAVIQENVVNYDVVIEIDNWDAAILRPEMTMEKKVMKRVKSVGTDMIMVTAGGGRGFSPPQIGVTTLRLEDAEAIRERIRGAEIVSPFAMKRQVPVKGSMGQTPADHVVAVEPNFHEAWNWYTREGDLITPEDTATLSRVCLLGKTLKRDLFGEGSAIGEYVQVHNIRFKVKGILEKRGTTPMGGKFDSWLLIPLTTGLRRTFNQDYITNIRVKVKDPRQLGPTGDEIRQLLHERHHITPPQEDDFAVFSAVEIAMMARGISGTLNILLIALAGLSLIVGGVVLMNIMLISVSERTKEIGLRRAVGATQGDILLQFLAESLTVTFLGMISGSVLGSGLCLILRKMTKLPVVISWEPLALAVVFSFLVGIFFGVQPARRASRLHPVEALR
ncbi:MAG: ABC transporter permease [bacterium]